MNRYKVTATRSNGTELSDYFIEATEGAARKTFKECYRNEEYSDVKVELVAEYVQATKEQEREALAKIVKIIEGLGPGSYVGIAFEGCFKDAEDNIENDFGCSMKQKLESAETRLADAEERLKELGGLIAKLKEERKALEEKLAKQSLPEADGGERRDYGGNGRQAPGHRLQGGGGVLPQGEGAARALRASARWPG
jgi:hypothetical protein